MPNQPKTPVRTLRVPDELWQAAKTKAATKGTTISAELNAFLRRWVAR